MPICNMRGRVYSYDGGIETCERFCKALAANRLVMLLDGFATGQKCCVAMTQRRASMVRLALFRLKQVHSRWVYLSELGHIPDETAHQVTLTEAFT